MGDAAQHMRIFMAIPSEKHLTGPEYARHTVYRNAAMAQDMKIVVPKLIFDEKGLHWAHQAKEADGVDRRVKRKVADDVGSFVVLRTS